MQTDLESELRFRRYCIFRSESRKDSLHACFLVGGQGVSCGWLPPTEGLCICYIFVVEKAIKLLVTVFFLVVHVMAVLTTLR
jgi:hypothetical protein